MDIRRELQRIDDAVDALGPPPLAGQLPVAFAISLRSARTTANWPRVCQMLEMTLHTALAQTDQTMRVVVAGHERPPIAALDDPRIEWLEMAFDPPADIEQFGHDKMLKRRHVGVWLREHGFSGFVMPLDGDDWLHRRCVEYVRRRAPFDSLYFDAGFLVNWGLHKLWQRDGAPGSRPFYMGSGSGAVYRLERDDLPPDPRKETSRGLRFWRCIRAHTEIEAELREAGEQTTHDRVPLVTWVLGHGTNMSTERGRKPVDFVDRNARALSPEFFDAFRIGEG